MYTFIQRGVEDARHLAVANVVSPLVGVGGHERAVDVHQIAFAIAHGQLVACGIHTQGAMACVVKDHRIAFLRNVDEVLLHGRQDAVPGGLRGRQNLNSGTRRRYPWICQQDNIFGQEVELGTGEHFGHRLRIVHRSIKIVEGADRTSAILSDGGIRAARKLGRGARRLVSVYPDNQSPLGLRKSESTGKDTEG